MDHRRLSVRLPWALLPVTIQDMQRITISIGTDLLEAQLNDCDLAKQLAHLLPAEIQMSRWGDEYYGTCGLASSDPPDMSTSREIMQVGEIAYWPSGDALCFFFGQTPASTDERPRAVSPVVPLGVIHGNIELLKSHGTVEVVRLTSV